MNQSAAATPASEGRAAFLSSQCQTENVTLESLAYWKTSEAQRMAPAWKWKIGVAAILLGAGLGLPSAQAGLFDDSGLYGTPWERFQRAGNPACVAPWARPSNERRDVGYYVGGGLPTKRGEGRYVNEGTWGWDYRPPLSSIALRWSHGRRYQGGTGQYQPEAPVRTFHQFKGPK